MSKHEKLLEELLSKPKDFTFDQLITLMSRFGYNIESTGKTGGSRIQFANGRDYIRMHKPHPRNTLKPYQITAIISALEERGLL